MAQVSKPYTQSPNTTISSSELNANFDTIYNEFNGKIDQNNIADNAVTSPKIAAGAVSDSKIATGAVKTAKIDAEAVTAPKTSFGGSYSTTEVNTGFKWIDGKDIYKKTVNYGALPNNTARNVAHGITDLGTVVDLAGIMDNGTHQTTLPTPANSTNVGSIPIRITSTNINVDTSGNWSSYSGYVTIWYTKS